MNTTDTTITASDIVAKAKQLGFEITNQIRNESDLHEAARKYLKTASARPENERGERCGFIAPGRPVSLMTGVQYAKVFASGKVTLVYEDNTTETATLTKQQIIDAKDNFFTLVGSVQSYRKP